MKVNSVTSLIGNTPLIKLENLEKYFNLSANLYAKVELFNPAGSIKDRVALAMIQDLEDKGLLTSKSVIIEPTSGNTGIGIASICAARGYRCVLVMPESMSIERRKLLKAYGAEIVLSPASLGMKGAITKAEELKNENPDAFILGQFDNPKNVEAHYLTTGPEIFKDLEGNVDIFVSAIGTGGTITGTAKYLREHKKDIHIVGVEPSGSPMISKGTAGPHKIQGIGAGFIPSILDTSLIDEMITINDEDAFTFGALVGKKEGFLVGISSGAALKAAVELAKREENKGKNIVIIFPDSGDRYLSTPLFDN